jgi:hypothetical protein
MEIEKEFKNQSSRKRNRLFYILMLGDKSK